MRILDKYIVRNFLYPFFYCLFVFIFLYIIIDLFGHLDELLRHGVPILILQEYYLSMIPFIIMHTTPIAALISTIYLISTMNRHDEITAMRAAGISIFRILAPFVFMGFAISIGVFLVSEKVLPASMKNAQSIKESYIDKEEKDKKKVKKTVNNIALYGKNDRLIFIESYDILNNIASGITILQQDTDGNVIKKTSAREGKWRDETTWVFTNMLLYQLDEEGMVLGQPMFFEEKDIDMEDPKDLIAKGTYYEFMNFKDLSNYMRNFSNTSPHIIQRLNVDLHQKISFPFTSLVIILLGAAFAIKIKRRGRAAALIGMGIGIVIGFIYYALMAIFLALGKGGILPAFLSAHLANILFGLLGIILIRG